MVASRVNSVLNGQNGLDSRYSAPEVTVRDKRTLEIRSFYPLPRGEKEERSYALDAYLFIPNSFQITEETFSSDDFYRAAQVWMRVQAKGLSLEALNDLRNKRNPAFLLRKAMDALLEIDAPALQSLQALAQMFGAELADAIRRESRHIHDHLDVIEAVAKRSKKSMGKVQIDGHLFEHLDQSVADLCEQSVKALGVLHRVRSKALAYRGVVHRHLFSSLGFAEEFGTAILDEELALLGQRIDELSFLRDGTGRACRLRLEIAHAAKEVNQRRLERGFGVPWGKSPEYFSYRIGLIKKELQRSLYIDTRGDGRDPFVTNSAAMVAAGLAATWATLAQLPLWTGGWNSSGGVWFLFVAVGAYVLKDRIKEWTRSMLVRRFMPWDHRRKIVGQALAAVGLGSFSGRVREAMCFIHENGIPSKIHELRVAHRTVRGIEPELEQVLLHQRKMTFVHERGLPEGYGVQEIYRISFDNMLKRLDDPLDYVSFYDHSTGQFATREMPKVYHINLILQSTCKRTQCEHLMRLRVVLNRRGILRVDPVHQSLSQPELK